MSGKTQTVKEHTVLNDLSGRSQRLSQMPLWLTVPLKSKLPVISRFLSDDNPIVRYAILVMHSKNRVEHESLKQQFWHNLLMTRPAKKQLKISSSITSKTEENAH